MEQYQKDKVIAKTTALDRLRKMIPSNTKVYFQRGWCEDGDMRVCLQWQKKK